MIQFAKKLVHHRKFIVFLAFILLIPSTIGIVKTRINYDILSYLPDSLETVKGQDIMVDQFGAGAYSMIIVEDMNLHDVQKLKQKLEKVDHVDKIIWYDDIADLSVPKEMLPEKVRKIFFNKNATMMIAMFKETTSSDNTMEAVTQMRKIVGKQCFISGMSGVVTDIKNLVMQEIPIYVTIAAVLSLIVLFVTMESFAVAFLFLLSIGMAILYNLGTNIFLSDVSYLTMALTRSCSWELRWITRFFYFIAMRVIRSDLKMIKNVPWHMRFPIHLSLSQEVLLQRLLDSLHCAL